MKVCTDSCVFAAWVAEEIEGKNFRQVLDIGAGTGLLSLMLAQVSISIQVDAVELDNAAATQASQNFESSPFTDQLRVFNENILQFNPGKMYDFIISNPPFYEQDLKSEHAAKNAAKHDTQLTLALLIGKINQLLSADGEAAILLPFHRELEFETLLAKQAFFIHNKLLLHQSEKHTNPFRVCWIFGRNEKTVNTERLYIKDAHHQYSPAFTRLLKPYYLKL